MKIGIVVDSGCDISQEEAVEKGIKILPLKTTFGNTEYLDGVTITPREFYEKLVESDEYPHTSQVAPIEYEEAFEELLKDHDHVLCLALSSGVSGCFQSANIAAIEFPGKVTVVDSKNVSLGERNFVDYALKLLNETDDITEIERALKEAANRLITIAVLDTLDYLKKGGRISAAVALAGSVLSIKPVITTDEEGKIVMMGKARGSKNVNNYLTECVRKRGPIDYDMPYCLAYSGFSDELLKKYYEDNKALYNVNDSDIKFHIIGCSVGAHSGPNAIACSFFVK